uniref:Phosphoglycolate phosphatase n=1 Tax=Ornithorhynchus anatinus TaxID=9258 RepID=A0A6I8N9P5_ORNAN
MTSVCGELGAERMAGCKALSGGALREVVGRSQGILFDCDGVLWSGERPVPGAPELLDRLGRGGKAAFFVSNNSRRSRQDLQRRFSRLGFRGVAAERLFSSALCSALLLRHRLLGPNEAGDPRRAPSGPSAPSAPSAPSGPRAAGEAGGPPDAHPPPVRAVLVGYDDRFTFDKLSQACTYLRDPDCLLVFILPSLLPSLPFPPSLPPLPSFPPSPSLLPFPLSLPPLPPCSQFPLGWDLLPELRGLQTWHLRDLSARANSRQCQVVRGPWNPLFLVCLQLIVHNNNNINNCGIHGEHLLTMCKAPISKFLFIYNDATDASCFDVCPLSSRP